MSGWLKTEAGKSRKPLHDDLVKLGCTGFDGRVAAVARVWRADRQKEHQTTGCGTFVPRVFQSGEAFQFDWNEDFAIRGGARTRLQVAYQPPDAFLVHGMAVFGLTQPHWGHGPSDFCRCQVIFRTPKNGVSRNCLSISRSSFDCAAQDATAMDLDLMLLIDKQFTTSVIWAPRVTDGLNRCDRSPRPVSVGGGNAVAFVAFSRSRTRV